jgi:hypothetical protein
MHSYCSDFAGVFWEEERKEKKRNVERADYKNYRIPT